MGPIVQVEQFSVGAIQNLRRWGKCAREDNYIINHAAGFNRCSSELQDRMSGHINLLCSCINKGKAPKEVSGALSDLKDLMAFHQSVSGAMGTALQHLADSSFVHLAKLILLRRDSYLEHIKPGVKQDTWLQLRNAPLFGYGLFPDNIICQAEQDSASVVPGPGPGAQQHTSWRSRNRYWPYDRRENTTSTGQQSQQPWRQFSRSNRSRDRGRARGCNTRFSKSHQYPKYYCVSATSTEVTVVQLDKVLSVKTVKCSKVHRDQRQLTQNKHQIVSCPVCHVPLQVQAGFRKRKVYAPLI